MANQSAESKISLINAIYRKNTGKPPVWFMRQAGRYHAHYQNLRARHSFMDLCKIPSIARDVTFGPLDEFKFDAAILFSDLLFPLEALSMGLTYEPGPKMAWHLKSKADLARLKIPEIENGTRAHFMEFQAEALRLIRQSLPQDKGLIGFVGGPWTLFCYAVEGSHAGGLESSKAGLTDGRFTGFLQKLVPLLVDNMVLQAKAGAHTVALFDTCGGEVDACTYKEHIVPSLKQVIAEFKQAAPGVPVIYYSKKTNPEHWRALDGVELDVLGVDWRHDLVDVLKEFGHKYAIQGNMDPDWLSLEPTEFETKARAYLTNIKNSGVDLSGWISGLGHGCTPQSKEANVKRFVELMEEYFGTPPKKAEVHPRTSAGLR